MAETRSMCEDHCGQPLAACFSSEMVSGRILAVASRHRSLLLTLTLSPLVAAGALVSQDRGSALANGSQAVSWSAPRSIEGPPTGRGLQILSITCPTALLCLAVDEDGRLISSTNPGAASPIWSAPKNIDPLGEIESIACPSAALCLAVDSTGNVLISTNQASGAW